MLCFFKLLWITGKYIIVLVQIDATSFLLPQHFNVSMRNLNDDDYKLDQIAFRGGGGLIVNFMSF